MLPIVVLSADGSAVDPANTADPADDIPDASKFNASGRGFPDIAAQAEGFTLSEPGRERDPNRRTISLPLPEIFSAGAATAWRRVVRLIAQLDRATQAANGAGQAVGTEHVRARCRAASVGARVVRSSLIK